jgi:hypothetical protein
MSKEGSEKSVHIDVNLAKKVLKQYQNDIFDYNRKLENKRLGKVLTIIDGSIADATQRKAVKDLVNDMWYSDRFVDGHSHYPRMDQATEAIGFELWDDRDIPMGTYNPSDDYNKYKNIK